MTPDYPNLELLEYKARQFLAKDKETVDKANERRKENRYAGVYFEALLFPQMWGSTCAGFDVMEDGSASISGCAMTDTYVVCFGNRPCYKVSDANEAFFADLKSHNMASLSEAKKRY